MVDHVATVVYPGTFDPVTLGHLDLIKRSALLFDEVVVAVSENKAKLSMFSGEQRQDLITKVLIDLGLEYKVKVAGFDGLLADFLTANNYSLIVRGLRAISDFEYELQLANTNRIIGQNNHKIETLFFSTSVEYSYISSTLVREIASYGGPVEQFVHPIVAKVLKQQNS